MLTGVGLTAGRLADAPVVDPKHRDPAPGQPAEFPDGEGTRVKAHHSIRSLTADADLVVLAQATSVRSVERIESPAERAE